MRCSNNFALAPSRSPRGPPSRSAKRATKNCAPIGGSGEFARNRVHLDLRQSLDREARLVPVHRADRQPRRSHRTRRPGHRHRARSRRPPSGTPDTSATERCEGESSSRRMAASGPRFATQGLAFVPITPGWPWHTTWLRTEPIAHGDERTQRSDQHWRTVRWSGRAPLGRRVCAPGAGFARRARPARPRRPAPRRLDLAVAGPPAGGL
jgi:hypothetical protein